MTIKDLGVGKVLIFVITSIVNTSLLANSYTQSSNKIDDSSLEHIAVKGQRNLLNNPSLQSSDSQTLSLEDNVSLNRTIADWLVNIPGLSLNGQGGLLQSYSIRGFSRGRIRTEVDGIVLISDRKAGNSASFIAPQLLDTLTVHRGPSSTLYGTDAMGGVVEMSTIAPDGLALSVGKQTNDQQQHIGVYYGDEHWTAAAIHRQANNGRDAQRNTLNTAFNQSSALIKYQQQWQGINVDFTWLPSHATNIGKSSQEYPNKVTQYPEEIHNLTQFKLTKPSVWLAKFYHHYQQWQSKVTRPLQRSNVTSYQAHTLGTTFYHAHQLLSGNGRIGLDWIGRRGVSIDETEHDWQNELNYSTQLIDGQQNNLAVFIDDQWQFERLKVSAGVRFDTINLANNVQGHSSKHDNQLNGSFTVQWQLNPLWQLNTTVGTGFRFPSLTELFFAGETPRGVTIGQIELQPERSKGLQVNLTHKTTSNFTYNGMTSLDITTTLASYYYQLDDYIERFFVDNTQSIRSYRNFEQAHIKGFEFSSNWLVNENWSHQLSYQWQQGKDNAGNYLADLNPPSVQLTNSYHYDNFNLNNQIGYRLRRLSKGQAEQELSSALLWKIKMDYYIDHHWQVSIFGNNLLNKQILASADEDSPYQQGRTFGIKLRWQN
jgi:iron complex outermembrane receptor protein